MTEGYKFFKLIRRYRLALIIIPIITGLITAFFVRNLKSSYLSQAQISTGLVNETQQQAMIVEAIQGEQVRQQFSNLMEMFRMKRVLNQVSYQLIIHDLSAPKPFKPKSDLVETLNQGAITHALAVYRDRYAKRLELDVSIPDEEGLARVISSMNYDADALKGKLSVYRLGESDFINVQYEAEGPELAAFVVNTVSEEFIKSYVSQTKSGQNKVNSLLREMLTEKSDSLATRMARLKDYKIRNKVLNLTEQSSQLYSLILQYDTKKQEAIEKTASYAGALNEIDAKFNPSERSYIESRLSKVNQGLVETKSELNSLYELYLKNDLDQKYKDSYDSLRNKLSEQISKSSDQYINNPLNAKQELINQKINLEIQMDLSRYGINSLENKLNSLNKEFGNLVPQEAEVQTLEMNVDIASKEYLDILNKYNQSSLESSIESRMNIVQRGVGGLAQPSKKLLLIVLSVIVSGILCLSVLFILFITNSSISDPKTLAKSTGVPVLGTVYRRGEDSGKLPDLWDSGDKFPSFAQGLRSIRYELEAVIADNLIVITSLRNGDGKTFVSKGIAVAWAKTNRKVLIIDGNFEHPDLGKEDRSEIFVEDFLSGKVSLENLSAFEGISILKNRGFERSLLEIASAEKIAAQLEVAKDIFSLVIVDLPSVSSSSLSREWISFSSNIIPVFNGGSTISEEEKSYVELLKENGLLRGWIMNRTEPDSKEMEFFKV